LPFLSRTSRTTTSQRSRDLANTRHALTLRRESWCKRIVARRFVLPMLPTSSSRYVVVFESRIPGEAGPFKKKLQIHRLSCDPGRYRKEESCESLVVKEFK
jgi:hypothetical protein